MELLRTSKPHSGRLKPVFERALATLSPRGFWVEPADGEALTLSRDPFLKAEDPLRRCARLTLKKRGDEVTLEGAFETDWDSVIALSVAALAGVIVAAVNLDIEGAVIAAFSALSVVAALCVSGSSSTEKKRKEELRRLLHNFVSELAVDKGLEASSLELRSREAEHERCAYCHADAGGDPLPRCPGCGVGLHAACWGEAEGCPSLGCRGARPRPIPVKS